MSDNSQGNPEFGEKPKQDVNTQALRESVKRDELGGRQRSPKEEEKRQNRPPVSREELSKGAQVFGDAKVNWFVLGISAVIILAFSIWAMMAPDHAFETMESLVGFIGESLGWYYVLTVFIVISFVLWVALSRTGKVRLGPDHSRPHYSLFTWVSMLFAAGVGIDMLFYSVTGPITQYVTPPDAEPESAAAARDAVVWTMFHYGIGGWAMYSLLGMAMGYFAYRWGMPLSVRAALYPLLGKRVRGKAGDAIDIVTLVGTVMGVATSMGIGVVLLSVGFSTLFGFPDGLGLQIALVIVAVVITIAACTSGVDKGIRLISELNLWSAGAMILYIIVTGQTSFLLNGMVENIGRFINTLPERSLQTMVYQEGGSDWMAGWTLFFWAFWLAWGPFVGMFLARISRGRTLREFVIAAITVPVLCDFLIVTTFGNSALYEVLNGNDAFAQLAMESPEQGWYTLLEMFPGATFLVGLATLSGLLFYLTSANSGAMVMANFSSSIPDPAQDGAKWLRILWAVITAILTIAMLLAGGVTTMEYATLIFALPVTIIAYLVMASFLKVLRMERAEMEGRRLHNQHVATDGGSAPEKTWRQRLASMRSYPSRDQVEKFVRTTVEPALQDVHKEFTRLGYETELLSDFDPASNIPTHVLLVNIENQRRFQYFVAPVPTPIPSFGGRRAQTEDSYYRLEVFNQTGTEGYDLMGLSKQQVIDDVIDRYETHMTFLTLTFNMDNPSFLTPPQPPVAEPALAEQEEEIVTGQQQLETGKSDRP
ncbi:high-affinity choline transport protein [Corynebacterium suranareeae]|uniref:High-affinity choline transport protein n=1 Tax=Corynebacterium suranareeae TaxID=2506452 RepID=A0A161JPA4_9CORY|nr:choline BCCT transporter BetT [Corynebacterium suranareeae]BAU96812.1 high-affinity choline transport protein [Corynebacterium suranareeae]